MMKHMHELIASRLTRRGVLKGTSGITASAVLGISAISRAETEDAGEFEEVEKGYDPHIHWPHATHECDLVLSWGDPIHPHAPAWEEGRTTAEAQALQFGDSCDFIAFMPLPMGSQNSHHGLLVVNHEFTRAATMFPKESDPKDPERIKAEMNGVGMSVVEVLLTDSGWAPVLESKYNRRLTASTPFGVVGPASGHARMQTKADPAGTEALGTLANCAGGTTPWNTVLSGEENINVFWTGKTEKGDPQETSRSAMGVGLRQVWHFSEIDERFDLQASPNEPNRFGWIIELDPYEPQSKPRKLTALGRFCHEGAEVVLDGTGHVVAYMGDDTADEHLYRFVSEGKFDPARPESNRDLLSTGTLSVAVFDETGVTWAPLRHEGVLAEKFTSLADILIDTRIAAKWVGATPMDRPERVAVSPTTNRVYVMLTKNPERKTPEGPNARTENYWGQILEIIPGAKGHTAARMEWTILLEGGGAKATEEGRVHPRTTVNGIFSCPDNAIFDKQGRLWVTTDGNAGAHYKLNGTPSADGVYLVDTDGPMRARSRLFFRGCAGSEITGPCFTPDNGTLFLSVQHPGRSKDENFGTNWPASQGSGLPPRSTVVALRRKNGGPLI